MYDNHIGDRMYRHLRGLVSDTMGGEENACRPIDLANLIEDAYTDREISGQHYDELMGYLQDIL